MAHLACVARRIPRTRCRPPRLALVLCLLCIAACRQDMHDQPRNEPLEASDFFADGQASRHLVPGTVARGQLEHGAAYASGVTEEGLVEKMPVAITRPLLERGRERYDIFCSPCHDRTGSGAGMIVQRGYKSPPSFHLERLYDAPDGYFFQVMRDGFGDMPGYAAQVPTADRWAIVAYIRALQLSQHAVLERLPEADRARLKGGKEAR